MKIKWGSIELAREGTEQVSGYRITGKRGDETTDLFRAEQVESFPRGNASTSVSFASTRKHSSAAEAEFFVNDHVLECQLQEPSTLVITCGTGGIRSIYNAKLDTVDGSYYGCSTTFRYSFSGGAVETEVKS